MRLVRTSVCLFVWGLFCLGARSTTLDGKYVPTWESLDSRPLPKWYDDAKVGIFIHWGVYAVPSYGSEWFWINWKGSNTTEYVQFMNNNYKPGFTYQDFASDFTAELFNATEWADLFVRSGARYVVLTSKHHEGYTLWPSKHTFGWNSMDVGPHRDIVGELAGAVRATGQLTFGVYYSLFEWFNRLYTHDRDLAFLHREYVDGKCGLSCRSLSTPTGQKFCGVMVIGKLPTDIGRRGNSSPGCTMTALLGIRSLRTIVGVWEPSAFTVISTPVPIATIPVCCRNTSGKAMTIDRKSWGHRANARLEDFVTTDELIGEIATTVSCGGNILINVGPTKAGTIDPIFAERLVDMGRWLKVNGDAIYKSQPWDYQNDTLTGTVWYTTAKRSSRRDTNFRTIFAIVLDYPYKTNSVRLGAFSNQVTKIVQITMLGFNTALKWKPTDDGILVEFPSKNEIDRLKLHHAWTLKITLSSRWPLNG
uniref:alpha-L-fucosidase n=1 Tax=Anopheles funestus TaxID=62324 RepID=A0A182RTY3_ANOFN